MKQIDIIREILGRLGFPTKGLEDFDVFKRKLSAEKMRSLSIVTFKGEVIGYYMIGETWGINHLKYTGEHLPTNSKPKVCSLGSELVARMKGGEALVLPPVGDAGGAVMDFMNTKGRTN